MCIAEEARSMVRRMGLQLPLAPVFEALQPASRDVMELMEESMIATKAMQKARRHGARTDYDQVRTYHIAVYEDGAPVFELPRNTLFVPGAPLLVLDFGFAAEAEGEDVPRFSAAYVLPWEKWHTRLATPPTTRTRQLAMLARMAHENKLRTLRGINGRF